ncbi:hypothetical protein BJX66DRAFT_297364 [Aspergillus keveii]|jgi:hypothetical protein|uniref:Uncharacterized protein n=1 Tax=Aspergillus keveii TaxID=714993 RepID=A0ABR4GEQ8_9EURO
MPPSPTPDAQLESDLLTHLASTHALEEIHTTLLSSLQRSGWTEKIRRLSLELLRANRCERFDEVVEAVVASAQGRSHPSLSDSGANSHGAHTNGDTEGGGGEAYSFEDVDVRIPRSVVEQGVRAIKDVLREVVILEDDGDVDRASGSGGLSAGIAVDIGGSGDASTGKKSLNGDSSPAKKGEKKSKQSKQAK